MATDTSPPQANVDWGQQRVVTKITYGANSDKEYEPDIITLLDISATNDTEPFDGLTVTNVGYVHKPQRFDWSIDVPITAYTYRLLRGLHMNRLPFHLEFTEAEAAENFKPMMEKLSHCQSISMTTQYRAGELPIASFKGKALRYATMNNREAEDWVYGGSDYPATDAELTSVFFTKSGGANFW